MALAIEQARTTIKTVSGLDGMVGLWQIAAPFILGYSFFTAATWNDVIFGVAVLVLAGWRAMGDNYKVVWPSWTNAIIGLWFIIAPFILSYPSGVGAIANDVIAGIIIATLATWSALATPSEAQR